MEPASQYNQLVKAKKEEIWFPFSKAKDKRKKGVKNASVHNCNCQQKREEQDKAKGSEDFKLSFSALSRGLFGDTTSIPL